MALTKLSRSIEGKVAIVTGAASGMGEATAKLFADEGARVAAIDINAQPLERVVAEIEAAGKPVRGWALDLADGDAIGRVFADIADHFGGIDILVNNAGISMPTAIDGDDFEAAWNLSLAVLLTAHTRTIRAAAPAPGGTPTHRQHRFHRRARRNQVRQPLHGRQNRRHRPHPIAGGGTGKRRHHRQLHLPGPHSHRHDRGHPGSRQA